MRAVLLGLLLGLSCLAPLSAQEVSGSPLPGPPELTSPASPESFKTLDEILSELEAILSESVDSSEKVKLLVTELQSRLAESRTQVAAVSTSLESSAKSLESSSRDLISLYRNQRLEVWVWRIVAGAAVIFAATR